jgi:hypothetical protein
MEMDGVMVVEDGGENDIKKRAGKNKEEKKEKDFEEFMDEVERDPKMREKMNLYKDEENIKKLTEKELAKK